MMQIGNGLENTVLSNEMMVPQFIKNLLSEVSHWREGCAVLSFPLVGAK